MNSLVYRPIFLEALRLLKAEGPEGLLRGDLSFRAPDEAASMESAFALFLCFWGVECFWKAERRGTVITIANCFGFRLRLELGAAAWEGGGWLDMEGYRLNLELCGGDAARDALRSCRSGEAVEKRPLPEGDAEYYAAMDARECAREGRESSILPPAMRAAAAERRAGLKDGA